MLMAASEAVPFAKTGGLADVCGALPVELARLGHQPALILPAYRQIRYSGLPITPMGIDFIVPIGSKTVSGHLLQSRLPGTDVPVYFVQQDHYFDREELYRLNGKDYTDNCERFVFFSRAVLEAIRLLELQVDIIHVNDWQTGLVPAFLKIEYRGLPRYRNTASLFTIHNMAYQGQFWHWDMLLTGLDWKYFNWHQMEYFGKLNLLKTGLAFADAVSTVSERYAQEVLTPEFGERLDPILRERRDHLFGILNGIDYQEMDPATSPYLVANYDADHLDRRSENKLALQREANLPQDPTKPLIGMVSRLSDQKGFDLLAEVLDHVLDLDLQFVILGTGEQHYHEMLLKIAQAYPRKAAVFLTFNAALTHKIHAGADMYLMPSRIEPCGTGQMIAMRYGSVPIVRATGGLADTVQNYDLRTGTGNGFVIEKHDRWALFAAIVRALEHYRDAERWRALQRKNMMMDFSWAASARKYVALYERALQLRG